MGHSRGSLEDKIAEKTVDSGDQVHKEMKVMLETILETISMLFPKDRVSFFPVSWVVHWKLNLKEMDFKRW